MIAIRRARASDAAAIGALHVAVWRSTYAGILPDAYLAGLSATRLAAAYQRDMFDRRGGYAVFVAVESGDDAPEGSAPDEATIIGFASGGRSRREGLADGEVNTLYLNEDYRDRGTGRRLMRAAAVAASNVSMGSQSIATCSTAWPPTRVCPRATTRPPRWR